MAAAGRAADPRSPRRSGSTRCPARSQIAICAFTAAGNDRLTAVGQWIRRAGQDHLVSRDLGFRIAAGWGSVHLMGAGAFGRTGEWPGTAALRPSLAGFNAKSALILGDYGLPHHAISGT